MAVDLFRNGHSDYAIIVDDNASASEQTAAIELRDYLKQVGNIKLPIRKTSEAYTGKAIYIGYNAKVGGLIGGYSFKDTDESFIYMTQNDNLFIFGGRDRGTFYGVLGFLENELGVRWYAPDCTIVPHRAVYLLPALHHSEHPAIGYRYNCYYQTLHNPNWAMHNRENMTWYPAKNKYGGLGGYDGSHTMGQFVPAATYFQEHPEYFALRNGKRIRNGQLCLSNPDVLTICGDKLLARIAAAPLFSIYSLSQNDNQLYCECANCKAIETQYGGHSGLILWFVNKIADRVKAHFPDKYVGTLAYNYTRKPPMNIVPRQNVVVRLCNIECCFAHPLQDRCNAANSGFLDDLEGWKQLTSQVFIWDYIVDFAQYMAPWPNFQVMAANIHTFHDNHAIGVFEEAVYNSPISEFNELKAWVSDKLLWNPNINTDDLVQDFIGGYYGSAAPKVWAYYQLCKAQVKSNTHLGIFDKEQASLYTDDFVEKGLRLLHAAEALADDATISTRVERVTMQMLYLYCVRHPNEAKVDGTWSIFKTLALKYGLRPRETQTLESFIADIEKPSDMLIPTADINPNTTWKFCTNAVPANWMAPDFDDSSWATGKAPFGTPYSKAGNVYVQTSWLTDDIYMRKKLDLSAIDVDDMNHLLGSLYFDDIVEIYLNGVKAYAKSGRSVVYDNKVILADEALQALKPNAQNMVAVKCSWTMGDRTIDFGMYRGPRELRFGKQGYLTMYLEHQDFEIPAGCTAYIVTGITPAGSPFSPDDAIVKAFPAGSIIPQKTGFILEGKPHTTYEYRVDVAGARANVSGNLMIGTAIGGIFCGAGYTYYLFGVGDQGVGFYWQTGQNGNAIRLKAHRAGLRLPHSAVTPAKGLRVDFELAKRQLATGLPNTRMSQKVMQKTIYNLQGQIVEHPVHGIYIMNGRKVLVK